MTPDLLTRLRSASGANSGHFEACLSIREVREIVAALTGMWHPIETAPKDREILVCDAKTADGFMQVVEWDGERSDPYKWAVKDGPNHHENCFTHWMSRPPIPGAEAKP